MSEVWPKDGHTRSGELGLDPVLWEVLACPQDHGALTAVQPSDDLPEGGLRCATCARTYPVRDGIAVMLLDEALAASE